MRYARHEWMIAPARARAELWRVGLGIVAISVLAGFLNVALFRGLGTFWPEWVARDLLGPVLGGTPLSMLVLLFGFATTIAAVVLTVRVLHQRGPATLLGPWQPMLADFWAALRVLVPVMVLLMLIPAPGAMPSDAAPIPNLAFGTWAALLPVALAAILIQTSAEELVFRGYLQQQLAARFSSPLVWMLIPSILFGIGHYDPGAGATAPFVVLWATLFGVAAADLTARSGTLGPAIALHLANNAMAMLITTLPENFSGLALYHLPFSLAEMLEISPFLVLDMAYLGIGWLACRVGIRR